MLYETNGSPRWFVGLINGSEPDDGSNTGADYGLFCSDDSGVGLFKPLSIKRSTGNITTRSITVGDGVAQFALIQNGGAGLAKPVVFQTSALNRWVVGVDGSSESGGNSGANFGISSYSDAGSLITTPLAIVRSTGAILAPLLAIGDASAPTIRSGTGAASGTQPKGSMWMRTDGGVGTTLYVSQGAGTWNPVVGV